MIVSLMGKEDHKSENYPSDQLSVLLKLYDNPLVNDYRSSIPSLSPRRLPLVGCAFTVYQNPTMIYQEE